MRKRRSTAPEIIAALREIERTGDPAPVRERLGVSELTLETWQRKYTSIDTEVALRAAQLEEANRQLASQVAHLSTDNAILRTALEKKW
jgi:hypothetical protein